MTKKNVKFIAQKTVQVPTTVVFQTKDGKTISFKAVETVKKPMTVNFRAKKR